MGTDLFAPNSVGSQIMGSLFTNVWKQLETKRIKDAQKLYDWYFNNKAEVIAGIEESLRKVFKATTVKRMNVRVVNITERTVAKLAQVYKEPAVRSLDGGVKTAVKEPTEAGSSPEVKDVQSSADKQYQEALAESTIAKKSKEWHKLGKLFNTVLVQPVWVERKNEEGYIDFLIHTPAWTVVETDEADYRRAKAFYYPTWKTIDGVLQQVLVYWSATEHYFVTRTNVKYAPPKNAGKANPYGVLPIAVLRFKEGIDFWGEGMWDLVDGNEEICAQLANICFVTIFQSHGQPVAVNMKLPANVRLGPDAPLAIDDAEGSTAGKAPPQFYFAQVSPAIQPVKELIDWLTKLFPAIKGLGPSGVQIEAGLQSGVSKIVDSVDVQENREDDVLVLEDFEHDLYDVTREVWNYHNSGKQIPETAEFAIKFAKPRVIKGSAEKVAERKAGVELGIVSRVDMILEDNPEMAREDAVEKLKQILAENRQFEDKYGLFEEEEPEEPEDPEEPPQLDAQGNPIPPKQPKEGEPVNPPPPKQKVAQPPKSA